MIAASKRFVKIYVLKNMLKSSLEQNIDEIVQRKIEYVKTKLFEPVKVTLVKNLCY
jgi:hypothetical protein